MAHHSVAPLEAVSAIKSGDRVFVQTAAAAPQALVRALAQRAPELRDVDIVHLHTEGEAPYAAPEMAESFHVTALFIGANMRRAIHEGRADNVPIFLSDIPNLFRSGAVPLDVALVHVSPPDRHGYCSLGVSVDATLAAVQTARTVIAQINPQMPRTHGDGAIHLSRFAATTEVNEPLPEHKPGSLRPDEVAIGRHCATLIEDGATLQMGIGAIPDAVLTMLGNHKDLGIHTEMFAEGVVDLVEKGVITGARKKVLPGKIVSSFLMGTRRLYDFVDDNPMVHMMDVAFVNDTHVIGKNPRVVAINSAIEVDLTGQVCADSIGTYQYSGVGGQMDFIRGAARSEGGKPIIALPSRTQRGESKIVPFLKQGSGVVTTRAHVHYIVTEHGIAYLHGRSLRERANALIAIAHPDDREALAREARARFGK